MILYCVYLQSEEDKWTRVVAYTLDKFMKRDENKLWHDLIAMLEFVHSLGYSINYTKLFIEIMAEVKSDVFASNFLMKFEKYIDVDLEDITKYGNVAIMIAAQTNLLETTKLLVERYNCNIDYKTRNGCCVTDYASERIIEYIKTIKLTRKRDKLDLQIENDELKDNILQLKEQFMKLTEQMEKAQMVSDNSDDNYKHKRPVMVTE